MGRTQCSTCRMAGMEVEEADQTYDSEGNRVCEGCGARVESALRRTET